MTPGENLKRLRIAAGYKSLRQFAKAAGIDIARASKFENDKLQRISFSMYAAFAKALGMSTVDELLVQLELLPPPPTLEQAQAIAKSELVLLAEQANRQLTDAEKDRITAFILFTMQDSHEKRRYRLEHPKDSETSNDHPPH